MPLTALLVFEVLEYINREHLYDFAEDMAGKRRRGVLATREGAQLLYKHRFDLNLTLEQVAEQADVSIDVVKRLFDPSKGKPTDKSKVEKIARVLGLKPTDFIDPDDWIPPDKGQEKSATTAIDWPGVCLARLARQEKQRSLRQAATEQGFELNVFVPLGLVERKQQPRSQKSKQLLEQETIVKCYEHDEFLQDVIGQGASGRNIAIVGEPGAGKTTILSKIAQFIHAEGKGHPIYISLGELKGKSLSQFLIEEWWLEAMAVNDPEADCTEADQKQFEKFLRSGNVWLLLDGVDEMANLSPAKALAEVRSLPLAWQVRVVVTCRSNIWDASLNNGMQGFETYRTQEFREDQIEDFIRDWFTQAECVEQGERLIEKLHEPRRERIFQLARNPLRLALLCQVAYRNPDAELPQTKAGLYEQFVNYFYEWKPNITDVDWATRPGLKQELHEALGRLALAGLDSEHRFCLPLGLIQQTMADELFKLAWELGWLNVVARNTQADEPIYAFSHPTFQEYFAALGINDWDCFLPRLHNSYNPMPVLEKEYRIFERHYESVLGFWIGRVDDGINTHIKNEFIQRLTTFNGGCGYDAFYGRDVYLVKAHFIAVRLLAEFPGCKHVQAILRKFLEWGIMTLAESQYYGELFTSMPFLAWELLLQTNKVELLSAIKAGDVEIDLEEEIKIHDEYQKYQNSLPEFKFSEEEILATFKQDFNAFLNCDNPSWQRCWDF